MPIGHSVRLVGPPVIRSSVCHESPPLAQLRRGWSDRPFHLLDILVEDGEDPCEEDVDDAIPAVAQYRGHPRGRCTFKLSLRTEDKEQGHDCDDHLAFVYVKPQRHIVGGQNAAIFLGTRLLDDVDDAVSTGANNHPKP